MKAITITLDPKVAVDMALHTKAATAARRAYWTRPDGVFDGTESCLHSIEAGEAAADEMLRMADEALVESENLVAGA